MGVPLQYCTVLVWPASSAMRCFRFALRFTFFAAAAAAPIPRLVHQFWLGSARVSSLCACSLSSWRQFARRHGFVHKLWSQEQLEALPMKGWTRQMWFPQPQWAHDQAGLLRASLGNTRCFGSTVGCMWIAIFCGLVPQCLQPNAIRPPSSCLTSSPVGS